MTRAVTDNEIEKVNVSIPPYTPPSNGKRRRTCPIIDSTRKRIFYRRDEFKKKGITDPLKYRQKWLADFLLAMCRSTGSRNVPYCFSVNDEVFSLDKGCVPFLIYHHFINVTEEPDGHVISVSLRDEFFTTYKYDIPVNEDVEASFSDIEDVAREQAESENNASKLDFNELMRLAQEPSQSTPVRQTTTVRKRNPYVAAAAKTLANGQCDLCQQAAPFARSDGTPYLECHHVVHLAEDGPDILDNAVALCPNCHRKLHVCGASPDLEQLGRRIEKRKICLASHAATVC